jgi:hypothetical protein
VVTNDTAGGTSADGNSGAPGGSSSSRGSGRSTHPSPSRPDKDAETTTDLPPDPSNWFDPSGVGGLFGVGAVSNQVPAGVASDQSLDSESALPSRDRSSSPSSTALLGLSLLIFVALAGGVAYRWWDHRPDRYWPA